MKYTKEIEKARKVLGISKSAKVDDVKKKYRGLAREWHPDVNNTKKAHKKMQEINHAFEIVMKEEFDIIDPWEDYGRWWLKQYSNDPILGNYVKPGEQDEEKSLISHHTKKKKEKIKKSRRNSIIDRFLDKKNVFAVVGASKNPKKYGNKVYHDLKGSGFEVYPVNPRVEYIDEDKCYPSLSDLPKMPDVVNIVVPPKITEKIVKDASKLGIKKIWIQPGAESKKAVAYCKKNDIRVLYNMCVIVERRKIN